MRESNSIRYPEAWKVFVDCVRKFPVKENEEYPDGWKYGIPNPVNLKSYLYSHCPGRLFMNFKDLFYEENGIVGFRKFLWKLERMEGKIDRQTYQYLTNSY